MMAFKLTCCHGFRVFPIDYIVEDIIVDVCNIFTAFYIHIWGELSIGIEYLNNPNVVTHYNNKTVYFCFHK